MGTIPADLQEWINEVTSEIPAADKERFNEIVSQERVAQKVRKSVLATPEFARKMDEVQRQLKLVQEHEQALAQWKSENEAALKTNAELATQYQREAQANVLRANELETKLKFYA